MILFFGILIRLILMPVTFHPDLWGHSFVAYFFAYEGKLNIYEHLASLPAAHPLVKNFGVSDIFIYPPLTYFTLGVFRVLVKPFADPNFIPWFWENISEALSFPSIGWQLTLFKLPYLFLDIGCAFLLAGLFDDLKKKRLAFAFWMFNPLTLYATFMIGQIDILPVFFTLITCYLIKKKRFAWALFSLGVGGSYKMYPLLLIIPAAFVVGNTLRQRLKLIFVGAAPFVATILPFLGSKAFRQMVLFSPKSQKMLFMGWNVSGAEVIFPFLLVLTLIYLISYYSLKKLRLEIYFLAILLLIFSVTHFHPQWFLWVTPFLIWEMVQNSFKHKEAVSLLLVSWFVLTLFFEPSLSFGLFAPLWPDLGKLPGLAEIMAKYTDIYQIKSIIRSVFAGVSAFYVIKCLRKTNFGF